MQPNNEILENGAHARPLRGRGTFDRSRRRVRRPQVLAQGELRIFGLPATILLNPDGKEFGRLVGPAAWDAPEMISLCEGNIRRTYDAK